jgi:hypothetical protein
MRVARLTELFRQTAVVDEVDVPRGDQIELLSTVAAMYAKAGLIIDGDAPPLWDCCPRSDECWRTALDARPSRADGRAGIALPWIGPAYRLGGVAVVALNLRDAGGLLVEYAITCRTAGEGSQLSCLAAGSRIAHRSRVAYASARSAAAIRDWIYGEPIRDRENQQISSRCSMQRSAFRRSSARRRMAAGALLPTRCRSTVRRCSSKQSWRSLSRAVCSYSGPQRGTRSKRWPDIPRMAGVTDSPGDGCRQASTKSSSSRLTILPRADCGIADTGSS